MFEFFSPGGREIATGYGDAGLRADGKGGRRGCTQGKVSMVISNWYVTKQRKDDMMLIKQNCRPPLTKTLSTDKSIISKNLLPFPLLDHFDLMLPLKGRQVDLQPSLLR